MSCTNFTQNFDCQINFRGILVLGIYLILKIFDVLECVARTYSKSDIEPDLFALIFAPFSVQTNELVDSFNKSS